MQILHYVFERELTLQASDRETFYLIARRRHFLHLHATLGTDKKNLGVGMTRLEGIGYCHCGEDVAPAATATNDCFHVSELFWLLLLVLEVGSEVCASALCCWWSFLS